MPHLVMIMGASALQGIGDTYTHSHNHTYMHAHTHVCKQASTYSLPPLLVTFPAGIAGAAVPLQPPKLRLGLTTLLYMTRLHVAMVATAHNST